MNIIDTCNLGTGYKILENTSLIDSRTPVYNYSIFVNSVEVLTDTRINIIEAISAAKAALTDAKRLSN